MTICGVVYSAADLRRGSIFLRSVGADWPRGLQKARAASLGASSGVGSITDAAESFRGRGALASQRPGPQLAGEL